jgi:hypothetical protein
VTFGIITADGIGGITGFIAMYYFLADKITYIFYFSLKGDD